MSTDITGQWPPPLTNRATRRHCKHRGKGGYCVDCGMPLAPTTETEEQKND